MAATLKENNGGGSAVVLLDKHLSIQWVVGNLWKPIKTMEQLRRFAAFRTGYFAELEHGVHRGISIQRRYASGTKELTGDSERFMNLFERRKQIRYDDFDLRNDTLYRIRNAVFYEHDEKRGMDDEESDTAAIPFDPNAEYEEIPLDWFNERLQACRKPDSHEENHMLDAFLGGQEFGMLNGVMLGIRLQRQQEDGLTLNEDDAKYIKSFEQTGEVDYSAYD